MKFGPENAPGKPARRVHVVRIRAQHGNNRHDRVMWAYPSLNMRHDSCVLNYTSDDFARSESVEGLRLHCPSKTLAEINS